MPYKNREKQLKYQRDYQAEARKALAVLRTYFEDQWILTPKGFSTNVLLIGMVRGETFGSKLFVSPYVFEDKYVDVIETQLDDCWKTLKVKIMQSIKSANDNIVSP